MDAVSMRDLLVGMVIGLTGAAVVGLFVVRAMVRRRQRRIAETAKRLDRDFEQAAESVLLRKNP